MDCKIVNYEEAHFWLKKNPHLKTGYRHNHNNTIKILKSITTCHNDLLNIWTHLLEVIFMIIYTIYFYLSYNTGNISKIFIYLFLFASIFLFTCSSSYHLFRAQNYNVYQFCRKMDYLGISVLLYFSSIACYYYGFYFSTHLIIFYVSLQTIGFLGLVFIILTPKYKVSFKLLVVFFIGIGASNLIPYIHAIILSKLSNGMNGYLEIDFELFLIFLEWICFFCGYYFFSSHFPECKYPKTFDIWFNSHTIWHIWVNISNFIQLIGLISIYNKRDILYN